MTVIMDGDESDYRVVISAGYRKDRQDIRQRIKRGDKRVGAHGQSPSVTDIEQNPQR